MPKAATFVKNIRAIPTSIINADREEHSRFRRALSHGFSDAAMRQQEPLIARYVDLLLRRLHEICNNSDGGGKKRESPLNIEAWYNYATFDVVGELVFGHPFGCLERSDYHPWIAFIFGSVRAGAWTVALSYVGLGEVVQWVWSLGGLLAFAEMSRYIHEMLESRLRRDENGEGEQGGARDDLFEGLVKRREEWVSSRTGQNRTSPVPPSLRIRLSLHTHTLTKPTSGAPTYRTSHSRNSARTPSSSC